MRPVTGNLGIVRMSSNCFRIDADLQRFALMELTCPFSRIDFPFGGGFEKLISVVNGYRDW